jgi:uncharacterized protein YyaL (SSP411 family)
LARPAVVAITLTFFFNAAVVHAAGDAVNKKLFDELLNENSAQVNRMAASGNGGMYYRFSYVMEATLAQYEGTGDTKYLERVLTWAETMISAARIIDSHGMRNWAGRWASPHASQRIAYQLDDLQGATALARTARLILTDDVLTTTYGVRAALLKRFVQRDIVEKVLEAHRSRRFYRENAANPRELFSDKTALLVRVLLDLYRCDNEKAYRDFAGELLNGFTRRLAAHNRGALIWDSTGTARMDTAHANRMPYMAVDAYEAGVGVDREQIEGLSRLLTEVIWDQSMASPRFSNYIDGGNDVAFGRGPWGNGLIYAGWLTLGAYDKKVQKVGEATLSALLSGRLNPSLRYMNTLEGRLSLIGLLARNRRHAEPVK